MPPPLPTTHKKSGLYPVGRFLHQSASPKSHFSFKFKNFEYPRGEWQNTRTSEWLGGSGALMKFLLWSVGRYVVLYIWRAVLCCAFFWRGFCAVHALFGVQWCVVYLFWRALLCCAFVWLVLCILWTRSVLLCIFFLTYSAVLCICLAYSVVLCIFWTCSVVLHIFFDVQCCVVNFFSVKCCAVHSFGV